MSPNHPESVVTMLALLRLGAVECPVNAGLRGQQLAHVLNHSGARMLIVDGSLADRMAEQLPAAPGVTTVVQRGPGPAAGPTAAARTVPAGSAPRVPADAADSGPQVPAAVAVIDYDELRGSGDRPPPFRLPAPDDPMNIIYTSGTTGPAKGAVLPQAFPIEQARIKIEQWGLTVDDVLFSALPLYHVNAGSRRWGPPWWWTVGPRWCHASRPARSGIRCAPRGPPR